MPFVMQGFIAPNRVRHYEVFLKQLHQLLCEEERRSPTTNTRVALLTSLFFISKRKRISG